MKNKNLLMTIAILIIAMNLAAQDTGTFTDPRDGNIYQTVKIGTQVWMTNNLMVTEYNDGTPITLITDNSLWQNATEGAYSWYDNKEKKQQPCET